MSAARVVTQRLVPLGGHERDAHAGVQRPEPEDVPLRPRDAGALLDVAFDLFLRVFGPCVGFAVLCFLPMTLLDEAFRQGGFRSVESEVLWGLLSAWGPKLLVTAFVCSVVAAPYLGRPRSYTAALVQTVLALPGLFTLLVVQILVTVGTCCFGVLTPWVFGPITAAYVLERAELQARYRERFGARLDPVRTLWLSIVRGFRLTVGLASFGRWLGIVVVGMLAFYLPLVVLPSAGNLPETRVMLEDLLDLPGGPVRYALVAIGAVFLGTATVFLDVLLTVYYLDLRVRREALDLERELDRLSAEGAAP